MIRMNDSGVPWLSTDGLRHGTGYRGGATVSLRIEPAAGRSVWPQTSPHQPVRGTTRGTAQDIPAPSSLPDHQGSPARTDAKREVNRARLEDALDKLTRSADLFNKGLQFLIHEETERLIVRVIDKETQEVIREIPPERILDLVASIEAFLGLLFDERV